MWDALDLPGLVVALVAGNALLYLSLAGLGATLLPRGLPGRPTRRIQTEPPRAGEVRRDVLRSLRSAAIFGVVAALVIHAARNGHTRLRFDEAALAPGPFLGALVATILLHDAWFYWSHRALHTRLLFRRVHATHHEAVRTTAWTAYAFSPWEALVQAAIFPLAAWTIPMHPFAFAAFMVFQVSENVFGHAGWEIFGPGLPRRLPGVLTNTPTHHVQHHEDPRGNFGIYFNVWDRVCRTNHPRYAERFDEVVPPRG